LTERLLPTTTISSKTDSSLAYRNFVDTCRSEATRSVYIKALRYFMGYLRLPSQAYDKLLDKDQKSIQMDICDFITFLRKEHSSATVTLYVAALNKFYAMNDVTTLNWKKIHSFEGEREKQTEDRPYTHSEIRTLVDSASLRDKAIILLMSSAGLRVGAVPGLRVKDLEPVDRYKLYKVRVYSKSVKSRYVSMCTPECRSSMDQYLELRKRWGERITDDSPLFRTDYNVREGTRKVRPITVRAVIAIVNVLLRNTGLRHQVSIASETETETAAGLGQHQHQHQPQYKRFHIMMTHGFRKFFETNAFKAGMDHMYLRRLMGQQSGLEDAYLKLSEEELLEGDSKHVGYIGILDQLTIDESNKLRREVQTLKVEKSNWEALRKELDELKELFESKR
jgi:site-specific recombinase XerD